MLAQRLALDICAAAPLSCCEARRRRDRVIAELGDERTFSFDAVTTAFVERAVVVLDAVCFDGRCLRALTCLQVRAVDYIRWYGDEQHDVQAETVFEPDGRVTILVAAQGLARHLALLRARRVSAYGWVVRSALHLLVLTLEHELCHALIGPTHVLPPHASGCPIKRAFFNLMGNVNAAHTVDMQELVNAAFVHTWVELRTHKHALLATATQPTCCEEILDSLTETFPKAKLRSSRSVTEAFVAFVGATCGATCGAKS